MKKRLPLLFLLMLFPLLLNAQVQKERRVYYLDCSYSMVQLKINEIVTENLMNAIDKVEDETTELYVIPFAFDNNKDAVLHPFAAKATASGKESLKNKIKAIKWNNKNTMTYHKDPIEDFYNNDRVLKGGITYMFLMTDGKDEWNDKSRFLNDLKKWGDKYGEKNVYGFYVMLANDAKNAQVEKIVDDEPHFWKVSTADVNIRLARVDSKATYNRRYDECLELPIIGDASGFEISAKFTENNYYEVRKTVISDNLLKVYINSKSENLPEDIPLKLILTCQNEKDLENKFKFWVSDYVRVKCLDKKERTLKLVIK